MYVYFEAEIKCSGNYWAMEDCCNCKMSAAGSCDVTGFITQAGRVRVIACSKRVSLVLSGRERQIDHSFFFYSSSQILSA